MAQKVSAFGKAKVAKPAAAKASTNPIIPPTDYKDPVTGDVIYTKDQYAKAVTDYASGSSMAKRGTTMMENNETLLGYVARRVLAAMWVRDGRRPENPKLVSSDKGDGVVINAIFSDRAMNLTDDEYADLSDVVGASNAARSVEKGFEYSLSKDKLATEIDELPSVETTDADGDTLYVKVGLDNKPEPDADGNEQTATATNGTVPDGYVVKMRRQTYFDVVESALGEKFTELFGEEKGGELIEGLIVRKEVFKTRKGLVDRLLDYVGRDKPDAPLKLAEALKAAKIGFSLKPTGGPTEAAAQPAAAAGT